MPSRPVRKTDGSGQLAGRVGMGARNIPTPALAATNSDMDVSPVGGSRPVFPTEPPAEAVSWEQVEMMLALRCQGRALDMDDYLDVCEEYPQFRVQLDEYCDSDTRLKIRLSSNVPGEVRQELASKPAFFDPQDVFDALRQHDPDRLAEQLGVTATHEAPTIKNFRDSQSMQEHVAEVLERDEWYAEDVEVASLHEGVFDFSEGSGTVVVELSDGRFAYWDSACGLQPADSRAAALEAVEDTEANMRDWYAGKQDEELENRRPRGGAQRSVHYEQSQGGFPHRWVVMERDSEEEDVSRKVYYTDSGGEGLWDENLNQLLGTGQFGLTAGDVTAAYTRFFLR